MSEALLLDGIPTRGGWKMDKGCRRYKSGWSSTLRRHVRQCANFTGTEGLMYRRGLSGAFGLPSLDLFGVNVTEAALDASVLAGSAILVTQINNKLAPMLGVTVSGYTRDLADIIVGIAAGAAIATFLGQHGLAKSVASGPAMLAMIRIIGRVSGQTGLAGELGLVSVEPGHRRLGMVQVENLREVSLTSRPVHIPGGFGNAAIFSR